jgi:hypothetical protein
LLQQVPCLQCVLLQLPCDKKVPYCTRCKRSARGPCLVQRELLAQERWRIGLLNSSRGSGEDACAEVGYTVLVRLKSDDGEAWAVKKALEVQMLEYLQEQCDRANWVLPANDTRIKARKRDRNQLARRKLLRVDFARGNGFCLVRHF